MEDIFIKVMNKHKGFSENSHYIFDKCLRLEKKSQNLTIYQPIKKSGRVYK